MDLLEPLEPLDPLEPLEPLELDPLELDPVELDPVELDPIELELNDPNDANGPDPELSVDTGDCDPSGNAAACIF